MEDYFEELGQRLFLWHSETRSPEPWLERKWWKAKNPAKYGVVGSEPSRGHYQVKHTLLRTDRHSHISPVSLSDMPLNSSLLRHLRCSDWVVRRGGDGDWFYDSLCQPKPHIILTQCLYRQTPGLARLSTEKKITNSQWINNHNSWYQHKKILGNKFVQ